MNFGGQLPDSAMHSTHQRLLFDERAGFRDSLSALAMAKNGLTDIKHQQNIITDRSRCYILAKRESDNG